MIHSCNWQINPPTVVHSFGTRTVQALPVPVEFWRGQSTTCLRCVTTMLMHGDQRITLFIYFFFYRTLLECHAWHFISIHYLIFYAPLFRFCWLLVLLAVVGWWGESSELWEPHRSCMAWSYVWTTCRENSWQPEWPYCDIHWFCWRSELLLSLLENCRGGAE